VRAGVFVVAVGREVRNRIDHQWWNARTGVLLGTGVVFLLIFQGSRLVSWVGDTTLHSMIESMALVLAVIVGVLALVRNFTARDVNLLFVGLGFLGAAGLGGHHLFVTSQYSALQFAETPGSGNWPWVDSRLFLPLMLCSGALASLYQRYSRKRARIKLPMVLTITFALMALTTIIGLPFSGHRALLGLDWHTVETFGAIAIFGTALVLFIHKGAWRDNVFEFWLVMSIIVGFVAQTRIPSADGPIFSTAYFAAHGLKLVSYAFVLVGLTLGMYRLFKQAAANEAKTAFVATISHEIRTPLNAIGGTLGLLEKAQLSPQEHELLSVAKESNEVLLGIVNNVLDFSKIEAGKLEVARDECHPADIVDNVVRLLSTRGFRNRTYLVSVIDAAVPECIISDERLVRQVLLNLVSNAIKFSPDGQVDVGLHVTDGDMLCFEVADTGVGIPRSEQAKVFEQFSRALSRNTMATSGTGLGLPISKRLVELMGGSIGFTSRSGSGSTFWFTVPCVPERPNVLQPGADGEFAGLRALIVGMDRYLWRNLETRLTMVGVDVEFEDIRELPDHGVAALQRHGRFDVLFTAWSFFGSGGRGALGREWLMDNHRGLADRLVLMYSSLGVVRPDSSAMNFVDHVLTMPVLNRELWPCLEAMTGRAVAYPERRVWTRQPDSEDAPLRGVRLLLVEDSRANRTVESAILTRLGCDVDEATHGVEAVEAVARIRYDIVLMDLEMPQMNGFQAARRIRRLEGGAHRVPIVAVTAHVLAGTDSQCRKAGMDAYLAKPIDRAKLIAAITGFVPRRRTLSLISNDEEPLPVQQRWAN